ncbi:transglutaminase-like domain-containing protein [Microbulbifer sediminum]|uniref:transglutaminase-like domain-containing protein n=1 Tax=Microbulbifer sediminum TaxID=2904250 RepID=UPI001F2A5831|nr:transglutaminase-like domain-containing protein [Microbulbifer sediminum]
MALGGCGQGEDSVARVQQLADKGLYSEARQEIRNMLETDPTHSEAAYLLFEKERMRRIEMDFQLSEEELLPSIQRYIPDATAEDILAWDQQGLLESRVIDGERRFFNKTAYNLVHISDAAARRTDNYQRFTGKAPLYALHPHHREVITAETPPRNRIRIDYTLSVDPDAVPAGEIVRAWIPFPQEITGKQENVELISAAPTQFQLAPGDQAQRTVYFEKPARAGEPTTFQVSYRYESIARHTAIDPQQVEPVEFTPALQPYLSERAPHVVFTPELRTLSARIVGEETHPYRIAQKLFAHVDQIPWAGAREYSTIRNISQYAAHAGHADCGQQTLLLITLMRMNGIPARWQSGWEFSPESFDTMHDWGEFYLAPYGWLPMDVTHGKLGSTDETETWFYLGGLDAYRLIFNTDYSRPFSPEKEHFRSETVDSQRGEVEWEGGNLYFDQWDYDMEWEIEHTEPTTVASK